MRITVFLCESVTGKYLGARNFLEIYNYLIDIQLPFRQKNWCQKDSSVILQPSFFPSFFCPFSRAALPFSAENVR